MYPFTLVTTSSSASAVVAGGNIIQHLSCFHKKKKKEIFLAENVVEKKMRQNQVCVKAVMYESFWFFENVLWDLNFVWLDSREA